MASPTTVHLEHTAALFDAVTSKEHFVPLKFAYTGTAAQKHLELAKLESYKEVTNAAIVEAELALTSDMPTAICDIGPGDGQHSQAFLRELLKHGGTVTSYLGLDFSNELMAVAESRMRETLTTTIAFKHLDVEATPARTLRELHRSSNEPLVLTFLGQTLGNVQDPLQTLRNLRNMTAPGDKLLLSVALRTPGSTAEDYLRPYQNPTFLEAIAEPLRMAGLNTEQGKLWLVYEHNAVVGNFALTSDQTLTHPSRPATLLPKGIVVRCFLSRRFRSDEVQRMLRTAGWQRIKVSRRQKGIGVYFATAI